MSISSTPGLAIEGFLDFKKRMGSAYLTGPKELLNLSRRRTYVINDFVLPHVGENRVLPGGDTIKWNLQVSTPDSFSFYDPYGKATPKEYAILGTAETRYRNARVMCQWTREEMAREFSGAFSKEALAQKYVDFDYKKEREKATDVVEGLETAMWCRPSRDSMEGIGAPGVFNSIPTFVHEGDDWLTEVDNEGLAWSTVQGRDPVTTPNWGCQRTTYSDDLDLALDPGGANTVIGAFRTMKRRCQWDSLKSYGEHHDATHLKQQGAIYCSEDAITYIENVQQAYNDHTFKLTDSDMGDTSWGGIPFRYIEALNGAPLYSDGAGEAVAENASAATSTGYRYYFVDASNMHFTFLSGGMFEDGEILRPTKTSPGVYAQEKLVWGNLVCFDPRSQGIVSPTGADPLGIGV